MSVQSPWEPIGKAARPRWRGACRHYRPLIIACTSDCLSRRCSRRASWTARLNVTFYMPTAESAKSDVAMVIVDRAVLQDDAKLLARPVTFSVSSASASYVTRAVRGRAIVAHGEILTLTPYVSNAQPLHLGTWAALVTIVDDGRPPGPPDDCIALLSSVFDSGVYGIANGPHAHAHVELVVASFIRHVCVIILCSQ